MSYASVKIRIITAAREAELSRATTTEQYKRVADILTKENPQQAIAQLWQQYYTSQDRFYYRLAYELEQEWQAEMGR
jgi:hypothetical protein